MKTNTEQPWAEQSQHCKCLTVTEINLVVDNNDISICCCCDSFRSEHLSCSEPALELSVQIEERNTFVVVIRDCDLTLLDGVKSSEMSAPVFFTYFGHNNPYWSLQLAWKPAPHPPPGYEEPGAAEHLKSSSCQSQSLADLPHLDTLIVGVRHENVAFVSERHPLGVHELPPGPALPSDDLDQVLTLSPRPGGAPGVRAERSPAWC